MYKHKSILQVATVKVQTIQSKVQYSPQMLKFVENGNTQVEYLSKCTLLLSIPVFISVATSYIPLIHK